MQIVFSSDLHADFNQPVITWPEGDVLVVAGDIANGVGHVHKVMNKVARLYRHVVMVPGNHENYSNRNRGRSVQQTIASIAAQLPENVHLLEYHNPRVDIEGVHFIGCNGWYSFDAEGDPEANRAYWKKEMNDCHYIGFDVIQQTPPWELAEQAARLMGDALKDIVEEDRDAPNPIVAITHTAPHRDMITWKPDPHWNRMNSFYMNSHMSKVLESDLGKHITYWCHGHTHHRREKIINGVYCVANPRGYPGENPRWEPVVLPIG